MTKYLFPQKLYVSFETIIIYAPFFVNIIVSKETLIIAFPLIYWYQVNYWRRN